MGTSTVDWGYTYDTLGRLTRVTRDGSPAESYTYDAAGNRTSETNAARGIESTRTYTYAAGDRIVSTSDATYTTDADGFLTSRETSTGTTAYRYSGLGELLEVHLASGRDVTYDYDAFGRRVAKRVDGVLTAKYLWGGSTTLLAVYSGTDDLLYRFTYADGRLPVSVATTSGTGAHPPPLFLLRYPDPMTTPSLETTPLPQPPEADRLIAAAIAEDLGIDLDDYARGQVLGAILLRNDPTTVATVPAGTAFSGRIVAREPGIVAGLPYVERTWELLAELTGRKDRVAVTRIVREGAQVGAGATVASVAGPADLVLAGERTALDLLMVLSGIATESGRWQHAAAAASRGRLLVTDTRKTVPGLRTLSKYAVAVGGATNHRVGLWDMVLVKDNHLRHAGSVAAAVAAAREARPDLEVEVEADTIDQAEQAAAAGADYVLLDNMDDETLALAVSAVRIGSAGREKRCRTEASGEITFERLTAIAAAGVDRVSTSQLTMARPLDIGLDADP